MGDGQVGDAPGTVEQVFGAADWAKSYHGVLSVLEEEERLKEFNICGGFLVRRSPFKRDRFVISSASLNENLQVMYVLPPVTKRSKIKDSD